MKLSSEIWRAAPGWAGFYEISTLGRIRSLDRVVRSAHGASRTVKGKLLKLVDREGYQTVLVSKKGRKSQVLHVHRCMLQVFRPVVNSYDFDACHNNGKRSDNDLGNLRWDTRAGNLADMDIHGTRIRGDRHPKSKATEEQARAIRSLWSPSNDQSRIPYGLAKRLADEFHLPRALVANILAGRKRRTFPETV